MAKSELLVAGDRWEVLMPELRKFGVSIDQKRMKGLANGDPKAIEGVVSELFEIDNSPLTVAAVAN